MLHHWVITLRLTQTFLCHTLSKSLKNFIPNTTLFLDKFWSNSLSIYVTQILHYNGIEIVDALLSQDGVVLIFKEEDAPRAYEKLRSEIK